MVVHKRFARDGDELELFADQLVEALAQLLEEPVDSPCEPIYDLHSKVLATDPTEMGRQKVAQKRRVLS